jgi:hypothetical protein
MQPYFLPYIGYWQLMGCVDCFVLYDRIQYTKKGWINRNRFLLNGHDEMFTLPIRKAREGLDVSEREIVPDFDPGKLLARWRGAYHRAPYFSESFNLLERVVFCPDRNLFAYIHHSIVAVARYLGIHTPIVISSRLPVDTTKGRAAEKVIDICRYIGASHYVNPIGGVELYDKGAFARNGISLQFLQVHPMVYRQFEDTHVPWLSILDVLMFNSLDRVRSQMLKSYDLC